MAATYGFRHVRSNVRSNLYGFNTLKPYDTESEEDMTGRSAEDLIDGGDNTTDEEDMLALGDLLSDELPQAPARSAAPTVVPVLEEDEDEFESLLTDEEALSEVSAPAGVIVQADTDAMLSDMNDSEDDEFTGLDVPTPVVAAAVKTPEAPAKAPEKAPLVVTQLSNEDLLDDLDELELDGLEKPAEVESSTETETPETDDLDDLEDLEATPPEVSSEDEEEDPFEDTQGVKTSEKELTARQIAGRKAAQTRKDNSDKFKSTEIADTPSPFAVMADKIAAQSSAKENPELAKPTEKEFSTNLTGIKRALLNEAQNYTYASERDLYFYRLGVAEGLKSGVNAHFVSEPL